MCAPAAPLRPCGRLRPVGVFFAAWCRCHPPRRSRVPLAVSAPPSSSLAAVPFAPKGSFLLPDALVGALWIERNGTAETAALFAGELEAFR